MLAGIDRISERVTEAMNLDAINEIHIQKNGGLLSTWMNTYSVDIQATMD